MKPFAKLFDVAGFGQVLAKMDRSDDGNPELRWFANPPEFGVCAISLGFIDDDAGWDAAEKAFLGANLEAATAAARSIWQATGTPLSAPAQPAEGQS